MLVGSPLTHMLCLVTLLAYTEHSLASLNPIGQLIPRSSSQIRDSKWSIGVETQDRNYTIWSNYEAYVAPLGAKRGRLQAGWARCDPNGTGSFDFEWLDQAVFGLASKGIKPWIEVSYGNPAYRDGGGNGPGAGCPTSATALAGWSRWVRAVADRYANVTNEFEIWNEPSLSPDNYQPYARLAAVTCEALYQANYTEPPRIFYGTLSGGYASSGPAFINGTLPLLRQYLAESKSDLTLDQCISAVTYHGYGGRGAGPESVHVSTHSTGCGPYKTPCSGVEVLDAVIKSHVPAAVVIQGEAGAPAEWMHGGAMEPWNWTETTQLKWDLRAMIGDMAHSIVNFSSVFTMIDICYNTEGNNVGVYGLLKAPCTGTHPYENKTVQKARPAYVGVQTVMNLFDEDLVPVQDVEFDFNCSRKPGVPDYCEYQNASQPIQGRHCDFEHSQPLNHVSGLSGADDCMSLCCGEPGCTCWTWSPSGYNQGCWMFNSSVPNQPMVNLTTGMVHRNNSAPPPQVPFVPMGYAFRNKTATADGVTHIVMWDATTMLLDKDRLTQCNVTVKVPSYGLKSSVAGKGSGYIVSLSNGTVFDAPDIGNVFPLYGNTPLKVTIHDAPILVAWEDALPPISNSEN